MKPLVQLGLCCLLAQTIFAANEGSGAVSAGHAGGAVGAGHPGGAAVGHSPGHAHAQVRPFGFGGYGGYGYGGFGGYYALPPDDSGYYPSSSPPAGAGERGPVVYYPSPAPVYMQTAHPVIHEYTQPEDHGNAPGPESGPILYLIAFRDNTIRAAMTYWVDNGNLHYLDTGHKERQAPLSSVDRDMSAQLNRERHVPFNVQ